MSINKIDGRGSLLNVLWELGRCLWRRVPADNGEWIIVRMIDNDDNLLTSELMSFACSLRFN